MFSDDYDVKRRGIPRITMHLVAKTEECICPRLDGCGGIEHALVLCPEHGYTTELAHFHTHAKQVDQINSGHQRVR